MSPTCSVFANRGVPGCESVKGLNIYTYLISFLGYSVFQNSLPNPFEDAGHVFGSRTDRRRSRGGGHAGSLTSIFYGVCEICGFGFLGFFRF